MAFAGQSVILYMAEMVIKEKSTTVGLLESVRNRLRASLKNTCLAGRIYRGEHYLEKDKPQLALCSAIFRCSFKFWLFQND